MDLDVVELVAVDPNDFAGLAARLRPPTDSASAEADGELLADLAVAVGHDVLGVGEDADQAGDLDLEAGLFAGLADRGGGHGLREDTTEVIVNSLAFAGIGWHTSADALLANTSAANARARRRAAKEETDTAA